MWWLKGEKEGERKNVPVQGNQWRANYKRRLNPFLTNLQSAPARTPLEPGSLSCPIRFLCPPFKTKTINAETLKPVFHIQMKIHVVCIYIATLWVAWYGL